MMTLLALHALAMPKLQYFDARGAAELTRVLLKLSGKEFIDTRYKIGPGFDAPEFKADKASGALAMNLDRAPLLVLPQGQLGQSKAIERFVAYEGGLMGGSAFEAAQIDMLAEHVRDVKDAQGRKGFGPFSRDKTEEEKKALAEEWYSSDLPSWLRRIEACVVGLSGRDASHAVGGAMSYADVCIWALLREGTPEDIALVASASAECPTLNCIADTVAANPVVATWVEERPKTMF